MRKNEKGFTLVELIVVIAIVAILAAVGIIGYTQFISNARNTKAQSELDQLINVLYADSLVEGIPKLDNEGNPATDEQGKKILFVHMPEQGKVVFDANIGEDGFKALMDVYNPEGLLKGKFTLTPSVTGEDDTVITPAKLVYEVDDGIGSVVVVYTGEELTDIPATPSGD
jgi:prepilin-type N-terminal cleavage/methylation domain-containing protein